MEFNPNEFNLSVTESAFKVLDTLITNKRILPRTACTIKGIVQDMGDNALAEVTVYGVITDYRKEGYIKEGIKLGKAKTYYISEKGIGLYKHLFGIPESLKQVITQSMIETNISITEDNEIDYKAIFDEVTSRRK